MQNKLLIGILLLFIGSGVQAQVKHVNYLPEYTTHKIGDILPARSAKTQILIFADPAACWTCEESFQSLIELAQRSHIDLTLFLTSASSIYTDSLRRQQGWQFTTIADPYSVYAEHFGVKNTPFYYILAGDRTIRLMDKLGGADESYESIERLLDSLSSMTISSSLLPFFEATLHTSSGEAIPIGPRFFVARAHHNNQFAIADVASKTLYLVDSLGKCFKRISLPGTVVSSVYFLAGDSLILIQSFNPATLNIRLQKYNIPKDTLEEFPYKYLTFRAGYHTLHIDVNPYKSEVYATLQPFQGKAPFDNDAPVIARITADGTVSNMFGEAVGLFINDSLSLFDKPYLSPDSVGGIYEWESPSDSITYYKNGKKVRRWRISFDSTFKPHTIHFPPTVDGPFWVDYDSKTSLGKGLYTSATANLFTVIYYNFNYPPGSTNPVQGERTFYLHAEKGKRVFNYSFPRDTQPFAVQDQSVWAASIRENKFIFSQYLY